MNRRQADSWKAEPLGERISHLESDFVHLATKAELKEAFTKIKHVEISLIRWTTGLVGLATGIIIAVDRLAR